MMSASASARAQTMALAEKGHPLVWGAAAVSGVVLALFAFGMVAETLAWGYAHEATKRLLEYALIAVLGYWVGSSARSASKERMLRPRQTVRQAVSNEPMTGEEWIRQHSPGHASGGAGKAPTAH
jgi:hypothetical protein